MSFTGRIGTSDSRPGNLKPGVDTENSLEQLVEQALGLTDSARSGDISAPASQSIAFSQLATFVLTKPISVSQTLTFLQTATATGSKVITDALVLAQTATFLKTKPITVAQSLGLTQSAVPTGTIRVSVSQSINFSQDEEGHAGVANRVATDVLLLTQTLGRVLTASVSQTLTFTQLGERRNAINHTLNLTQIARVGKGGDVDQTLGIVQTIVHKAIFRRPLSQALGLQQSLTYFVLRGCTLKQYSPFVGSSTDTGYTAPSTVAPTIGHDTLTLTYPYVTPTTTLVLRNPEFGDKDRLNFNRINRMTRGGTLIVFSDPKWPKSQTLALQIDNLKQSQASELIAFLRTSLGKEIGLLDWEGRQWRGIITTPDAQVTHVGKHDRSVSFEFQGTLT